MPTKKKIPACTPPWLAQAIACRHPQHDPPTLRLYRDGLHEHTCPGCRTVQVFVVSTPTLVDSRVASAREWETPPDRANDPVPIAARSAVRRGTWGTRGSTKVASLASRWGAN